MEILSENDLDIMAVSPPPPIKLVRNRSSKKQGQSVEEEEPPVLSLVKKRSERKKTHFSNNQKFMQQLERQYFKMDSIDSNGQKKRSWISIDEQMTEASDSDNSAFFNINVFLEYGLYHLLFLAFLGPLSVPIIAWMSGLTVVKNMKFFNLHGSCYHQTITWGLTVYCFYVYYSTPNTVIYTTEICHVFLAILMRVVVIASKYATFSLHDLYRMKFRLLTDAELNCKHYHSAWLEQTTGTIYNQIRKSINRNEFDETAFFIQFMTRPSEHLELKIVQANQEIRKSLKIDSFQPRSFMDSVADTSENPIFYGYGVVKYLVDYYKDLTGGLRKSIFIFSFISSAFEAMLPSLFRWYDGKQILGQNLYETFAIIFAFLIAFTFILIVQTFILFGIYDLKRLSYLLSEISYIIMTRKDHCLYSFLYGKLLPTINLFHQLNIQSWLIFRKAVLEYGRDYMSRIQMLFSLTFLLEFVMSFVAILDMTGIIKIDQIFERLVLAEGLLFGSELIFITLCCANINDFSDVHTTLLKENKETIMDLYTLRNVYFDEKTRLVNHIHQTGVSFIRQITNNDPDKIKLVKLLSYIEHLEQLIDSYDDVLTYLNTQRDVDPFTILSVKVDSSFIKSTFAAFGSVFGSFIYMTLIQQRISTI